MNKFFINKHDDTPLLSISCIIIATYFAFSGNGAYIGFLVLAAITAVTVEYRWKPKVEKEPWNGSEAMDILANNPPPHKFCANCEAPLTEQQKQNRDTVCSHECFRAVVDKLKAK